GAARISRIESLHHHACEVFGLGRRTQAAEKACDGEVALEPERPLRSALRFAERVDAAEATVLEKALLTHRVDRGEARFLEQCVRHLRLPVDELSAEFHGDFEPRHAARPATTADAIARFEDEDGAAGGSKL